jgi:hypothetical protein
MLRFAQPPDAVFLAILHDALEDLQETLADLEAEDWPALYPLAACCFSPDLARTTLAELLTASRAPELYQLTDYHWLLLYDGLRVYCAIHNDYAREAPTQTRSAPSPSTPWWTSTPGILTFPSKAPSSPASVQTAGRAWGVADEVLGIAQGLPPHADELKLILWVEPGWEQPGEQGEAGESWISRYPPVE